MRVDVNWKPERLDIEAFARAGAALEGEWPAERLVRWAQSQWRRDEEAFPLAAVRWALRGECRERVGAVPDVWLQVEAQAVGRLECQRCLQAVEVPLAITTRFRFVRDEAAAEAEDLEAEEDVLALSRAFDAQALIEDELLLALPLVPLHATCTPPAPLVHEPEGFEGDDELERPHPFAALAALKKKP